ncbi:MAG: CPBP family intramembrane metalloprotease [Scytonematopsis contorta HA4267-MV1]|jgi:hypothetical protein|nr:CPBP family intramembrane metalloprotease [Scytonematopsis contorta HA4267-MV1]
MSIKNISNPFIHLKVRTLFLRFFLLITLVGVTFGLTQGSINMKKSNLQDLMVGLNIIIFVLLCLWSLLDFQRLGIKLKDIVGSISQNPKWFRLIGIVLLALIFSISAYLVSFSLVSLAAPSFVEQILRDVSQRPSVSNSNSLVSNLITTFALIIQAPITEEFIFRGLILQRWSTKWGIRNGLLFSSLLFGFLHPNPIGLSLLGIILGLLYIKTRTLIVPIFCHAMNNSVVVIMQLIPSSNNHKAIPIAQQVEQLRSAWLFGLVMMVITSIFLFRFLSRNWPPKNTLIPYFVNIQE